ncbi:MAG TPA: hypothetical protein VHL78_09085 [Actinomycetota bacterium]|nr:hypothetical protein [Actinomycetota bacterium]
MEGDAAAGVSGEPRVRAAAILSLIAAAAVLAALAAALILVGRETPAGVGVAGAGALLILAGIRAREAKSARLAFADASLERAVDAVILGAVAWAEIGARPLVSAAALVALGASYLAAYLRAKSSGLGFPLGDSLIVRSVRWTIVALGLVFPSLLQLALWVSAAVSVQLIVRHASAVARVPEGR